MPKDERSPASRIAEHKKYRRQCAVRIRSGLTLSTVGVVLGILLAWRWPANWPIALIVIGIPTLFTALEVWGYRKNDRAIRDLSDGS